MSGIFGLREHLCLPKSEYLALAVRTVYTFESDSDSSHCDPDYFTLFCDLSAAAQF